MILDFDPELAKLATIAGTGRVITRGGDPVEITQWDDGSDIWPIRGNVHAEKRWSIPEGQCWNKDGGWGYSSGTITDRDLVIETFEDV